MAILMAKQVPSAHWYTRDGNPLHEMLKKDGEGTRATTLADARKLGLLPSVTSIIGVLDKPALANWKMDRAALAAVANPKQTDESEEYWLARVRSAAMQEAATAADIGSEVHDAIDRCLGGEEYKPGLEVYLAPVKEWLAAEKIEIIEREVVVASASEGYAGRVDAFFNDREKKFGAIDWKTRKTKPTEKKIQPYDGQAMQLAAYLAARIGAGNLNKVRAINVYISTTEPGRISVYEHADLIGEYKAFLAACHLWRHLKGYDPRVR